VSSVAMDIASVQISLSVGLHCPVGNLFELCHDNRNDNIVTCLTKGNDRIQDTVAPFLERQ
jgi:hypothetical protein